MNSHTPVPDRSAVAQRKRRLLVLENEQLRRASAWWSDQLPAAAKSGYAAARRNSLANSLDYALIIVAILAAVSVFTKYLNEAFVAYAVLALALRTASRRVFAASVLSLVLVPISLAIHHNVLADTFATMTLYFLCIGLVRTAFEKSATSRTAKR